MREVSQEKKKNYVTNADVIVAISQFGVSEIHARVGIK